MIRSPLFSAHSCALSFPPASHQPHAISSGGVVLRVHDSTQVLFRAERRSVRQRRKGHRLGGRDRVIRDAQR